MLKNILYNIFKERKIFVSIFSVSNFYVGKSICEHYPFIWFGPIGLLALLTFTLDVRFPSLSFPALFTPPYSSCPVYFVKMFVFIHPC